LANEQKPPRRFVAGPLPTPINGTITVTVTGSPSDPGITLSGSGDQWSASGQGIQLAPESGPTYYVLSLELASESQSSNSLVGAQIYHSNENPSTTVAVIVAPVLLNGRVALHLLNDIPNNETAVSYQLFIGIQNSVGTHWPDPSIAFDPQM
jgi:hypothetical protein